MHSFESSQLVKGIPVNTQSVWVAEWLVLPTSDHQVLGSNPAEIGMLLITVKHIVSWRLTLSHLHHLDMTLIMLKGM